MTDYDKLVAALRYHADTTNCDACKLYDAGKCELKSCVLHDAADAIEALQAEVDTLKRTDSKRCQECLYLGQPVGEQQLPKRGEIVRCGECKYSSKPDANGEIWCKREGHGEDLMECHGVGWFCADGEREVQE